MSRIQTKGTGLTRSGALCLCGGDESMEAHRTVLIVEDNLINREILREILASEYQVLEAGDGQEALSILENRVIKSL